MGNPYYNAQSYNSGAFVASWVVPNRMRLFVVTAYSTLSSAAYVLLFDSVTVPSNGTIPLIVFPIAAKSALYPPVSFEDTGRIFANGICFALSSTDTSLTLSSASMVVDVIAS